MALSSAVWQQWAGLEFGGDSAAKAHAFEAPRIKQLFEKGVTRQMTGCCPPVQGCASFHQVPGWPHSGRVLRSLDASSVS